MPSSYGTPESTPTTDEASPVSTIARVESTVPPATTMRPVPEGAIVVSSPSELPNENGTKRPMVTVTDEEVANLEAYLQSGFGLVHDDGRDGDGRRVLVVNATRVPGWAGSADRDAALRLITKALTRAGAEGEAGRLAHLGMATALEYLDRREAALAELDEVVEDGEADAALERRRDRLRARRAP